MSEPIPRNFLAKPEAYVPVLTVKQQHLALPKCAVCGGRFAASYGTGKRWFCWPHRPAAPVQEAMF